MQSDILAILAFEDGVDVARERQAATLAHRRTHQTHIITARRTNITLSAARAFFFATLADVRVNEAKDCLHPVVGEFGKFSRHAIPSHPAAATNEAPAGANPLSQPQATHRSASRFPKTKPEFGHSRS